MSKLNGAILVGSREERSEESFGAVDPSTGKPLDQQYCEADAGHVDAACALATEAFAAFDGLSPDARAGFLETIADKIMAIGDELVTTAMAETGLPRARLEGERGRTCNQLRLFAAEVRSGEWIDATIDPALPDRQPPRVDLRRANRAVGPVAVFGASNFPLAFSVAGGDTASALAAGCPVVVKGHPAHPGTGELVARAIRDAISESGLPEGVFSYLPGRSNALGSALVRDPRIAAVGFTGSRSGGLALAAIAAEREVPIPVYAEMSSINPVILMPHALADRGAALGEAFAGSLVMGAGQFCTNPGIVLTLGGEGFDPFVTAAAEALSNGSPAVMLTGQIHAAYDEAVSALDAHPATNRVASGAKGDGANLCSAAVFTVSGDDFVADRALSQEVFGSASVIVRCRDLAQMREILANMEGQLTITFHCDEADEADAATLMPAAQDRCGRILFGGWPTGVEVCRAMVHGGPFPATTDPRTTSVGTLAMMRFVRPVCYQDTPDSLLPAALRRDNPLGIARRVDGVWEARA
ncbi:aldehyde dehydrogenase (NADP(+)) [uncultured Croceicoccus sp.]|uniref:aldehyde dehydrogenase (NADP(+)) n=1 Tax=uncultured Croceicoccus sp. TaxID=1295329 RepID=UPI00261316CE|nr:aldehyde dehydrogenase (NADP(+)) [uncultured Croceicoccus sp.]